MKVLISFILLLICSSQLFSQNYTITIDSLIQKTNLDTLTKFVRILSGEDSVKFGNAEIIFDGVRGSDALLPKFLDQKFKSYYLNSYVQKYSSSGKNVYAVQPGSENPDEQFIICAHYDAVANYCADDNASGSAAVIEAARILSQYQFNYSIVYALWDEEEIGLAGSRYYAHDAFSNDDKILGVLNLDMIGWDNDDDGRYEIHSSNHANSIELAEYIVNIDSIYNLAVEPVIYNPGTGASDHRSFWEYNYSAVLVIESYYGGDFNNYYHSSQDRINKFNLSYFHELSKLAVGTLSSLADINQIVSIKKNELVPKHFSLSNYPNPFNPYTTIVFSIPKDGFVKLAVFNSLGEKIATLVNEEKKKGVYNVEFNPSFLSSRTQYLPSGIYIYTIQVDNQNLSNKMILMK